ncbi:MAG: hypothetical protein ABR582_10480 [Gemmatimonadaceae bacterium]
MNRVPASLAVSAIVIGLAACADSATKTVEPSLQQPVSTQYSEFNDSKHIMKVKDEGKRDAEDAQKAQNDAKAHGSGGTGIYYHGGPVLQAATNVVSVYWSSAAIYGGGPTPPSTGTGAQDGSLVGYFLNHLGGSSYFNINTTYTDGSGANIVNAVNYTGFWANDANAPSGTQSVSDAQMVSMLQSGFDSGAITYDPSTLYAIFTSGKVNLGGGFGTQYCAYHTHGTVTIGGVSQTVLYAAMPYDQAYPGVCTNGTAAPNGDAGADAEVNTLAHETEETTTDEMGTAWFDRRGYENADKCAWTWGTTSTAGGGYWNITIGTKHFLVQQNWINSGSGGCRQGL